MVTIKSLSKSLSKSEHETIDLLQSRQIDIKSITFYQVAELVYEFRLFKRLKTKPEKIIRKPEKDINVLIDRAFSPLYQLVYQRYDRMCLNCDSTTHLGIHHIDFDHSNMSFNNLVLLCWSCHFEIHKNNRGRTKGKAWKNDIKRILDKLVSIYTPIIDPIVTEKQIEKIRITRVKKIKKVKPKSCVIREKKDNFKMIRFKRSLDKTDNEILDAHGRLIGFIKDFSL